MLRDTDFPLNIDYEKKFNHNIMYYDEVCSNNICEFMENFRHAKLW